VISININQPVAFILTAKGWVMNIERARVPTKDTIESQTPLHRRRHRYTSIANFRSNRAKDKGRNGSINVK